MASDFSKNSIRKFDFEEFLQIELHGNSSVGQAGSTAKKIEIGEDVPPKNQLVFRTFFTVTFFPSFFCVTIFKSFEYFCKK